MKRVVVHCSVSDFGDAKTIDAWHRENGWDAIGYHFVILNGYRVAARPYVLEHDGLVENGRDVKFQGAHAEGNNADSIGICLIGNHLFSGRQLLDSLPRLLIQLIGRYNLKAQDIIFGHYELDPNKTCPNIPMAMVKKTVLWAMANKILKGE
ncbi:MAG: N-acetylmuramoyl-L-alanine amidase [Nitrospinaceae bacterium]|nr:N-acetylmuramoyl-L-alanine amidase [Nitrospinaceae bacterium]